MKIKMPMPSCLRRVAFTLPEVVIGTALTAISVISLYGGITYGFTMIEMLRENLRATQVIIQKLETIRLYKWEQVTGTQLLPDGSCCWQIPVKWTDTYEVDTNTANLGIIFDGTTTIEVPALGNSYDQDLRLVTVSVDWTSGKLKRTRKMGTLVAKIGLQYYVY